MFIKRYPLKKKSVEEFVVQYGLEMEVHEREREYWPDRRYYACFTDTICDCSRTFGEGPTELKAIQSYLKRIEGKSLQIHPMRGNARINVVVPEFLEYTGEDDNL